MNQQDALRYLVFEFKPDSARDPSRKYGVTPVIRCVTAWTIALQLADNNEDNVDKNLLDEIMNAVNTGDNVVELFVSGKYAEDFMNKGSVNSSGP